MTSTRTQLLRLLGAWLAVTVLILSTGCQKGGGGGDKDVRGPRDASKSEAPPPTTVDVDREGDDTQAKPVDGEKPGNELETAAGSGSDSNTSSQEESNSNEATSGAKPVASSDSATIYYNPHGLTPEELARANDRLGENMLGEISELKDDRGSDLYYTGSGQDRLREKLTLRMNSNPDQRQRRLDERFAKSLSFGAFSIDAKTRRARASIVLTRDGQRIPMDFAGRLSNDGILKVGGLDRSGDIELKAVCMDQNFDPRKGCATALFKIHERQGGDVRNAYVLQRQTNAALYVSGNSFKVANNHEYDTFLAIIWNTQHDPQNPAKLKFLKLITTEVINGSADFTIEMSMGTGPRTEEVVAWNGPLVSPAGESAMDLLIKQQKTMARPDYRPKPMSTELSNMVKETRLVDNDGRGNLTIEVLIRQSSRTAHEDALTLQVRRLHTPTKVLDLN